MWSWWFDMTWFSDEQGLNNSLLFLSTLVVPVHSDEGEDDAVDVSLLRLFELITVKYPPAEWNDPRVYPVLHLLGVGQIVQLRVLLPLVSPVQPDADLQAEHEAHEACSHQHRTLDRGTVNPAEQDPAAYEVRHPRVKGAKDGGDFTEMLTHLKYFVQVLNLSSIQVH